MLLQRASSSLLQVERQFAQMRVSPSAHTMAASRIGRVPYAAAGQTRSRTSISRFSYEDEQNIKLPADLATNPDALDAMAEQGLQIGLDIDEAADLAAGGAFGNSNAIQAAASVLAEKPSPTAATNIMAETTLHDPDGFLTWDGKRALAKIHARPRPVSASYFTRQPYFNEQFLRLEEMHRQFAHLPRVSAENVDRVAWRSLEDYRKVIGEDVRAPQFNRCMVILKSLHRIQPALKSPIIDEIAEEFMRSVNPFKNVMSPLPIDRFGRAVGVGRRKTSTARAWVVEGTGEIIVNGKNLGDTFARVHDRESATWALRATDRVDKYNVWALVEGGGTTGQAEALTLAVARGMVAHEPALKTALRKAGCISRDPRMVERKKPGHVKARKMPTWVKR